MSQVPAKEIKRRGMAAVEEALADGPVHIVRDDEAKYVVLRREDYEALLQDLAEARLSAAEEDVATGRVKRTTAKKLLQEIGR